MAMNRVDVVDLVVNLVDVDLDVDLVDVDLDVDLGDVDLDVDLVVFLSSGCILIFWPLGPRLYFQFLALPAVFSVLAPCLILKHVLTTFPSIPQYS